MLVVCASGGRTIAAGRDTISHRPYITLLIYILFSLVRRRLSEWAITQAVDWRRPTYHGRTSTCWEFWIAEGTGRLIDDGIIAWAEWS